TDITNKTERVFKGEEPSSGADPSSQSITQSSGKGSASIYSALSEKNLQVIEGIGPKMASILKENGIHSWSDLANSTVGQLQQILDSFGTRYRIIDPSTWTEQARLASEGEWETLVSYQKSLSGGVNKGGEPTDSKVEKLLIKIGVLKKWKPDDLKAIEGIGPKTEELLHSYGIDTWWKLAKTETSKLQSILNEAGDRFALVDPGTWSKQARLAAEGDWKALEKYQDKLKWGKE
ncbi:MAG: helix-hairpin-helix domain-containing protein, partial [Saprospiraceae bacterium]|nr:helix-hairpin-helix domain-containing protein [Saprospiraceae bacterium]